jgi:biofilm protein TabA
MTILSTLLALSAVASTLVAQSDADKGWTKQKAKTWFDGKEWLNGLKLSPSETVDQVAFAEQYHLEKALWDSAFAFLKSQELDTLSRGKYDILGDDVFASVTEDSTKDFQNTRWESHRRYADIQYVIRGQELIGVSPLSKLTVTQLYDGKGDVAHYSGTGSLFPADPGTFFIFFPSDAHRPNITTGGSNVDKKVVIKVRMAGNETK